MKIILKCISGVCYGYISILLLVGLSFSLHFLQVALLPLYIELFLVVLLIMAVVLTVLFTFDKFLSIINYIELRF